MSEITLAKFGHELVEQNEKLLKHLLDAEAKLKHFYCTIPGRAYCKKTTQRAVGYGKFKRIIYSPQYRKWEAGAILAVRASSKNNPWFYETPVIMTARFYFKDRQGEADLSALYEGIQDVLEKCGVIKNDKLIVGHDKCGKFFGHLPRIEVELYPVQEKTK